MYEIMMFFKTVRLSSSMLEDNMVDILQTSRDHGQSMEGSLALRRIYTKRYCVYREVASHYAERART